MKEILKYLRTVNGFSQEQVAQRIGLSRQSYNKYEAGTVVPSGKVLQKLAELYKVEVSFIEENKLPKLPGQEKEAAYGKKDSGILNVASPAPSYGSAGSSTVAVLEQELPSDLQNTNQPGRETKTYDAYFSGNSIRLVGYDVPYKEGQRLKVTIEPESEEEEAKRKAEAWEKLQKILAEHPMTYEGKDPGYAEIREKAYEEKYGPNTK